MHNMTFQYRSAEDLIFGKNCQYYLDIPIVYDVENYLNKKVSFLIDTGAYVTVLSKKISRRFRFDNLPSIIEDFPLTGFTGSCSASLKEIPGMVIGGRILKGVKVAVPHEETKYNILGLNVLEHFIFLVDTERCKILFSDNFDYKMPLELKSADVLIISPDV